jgi:hypothetical protein
MLRLNLGHDINLRRAILAASLGSARGRLVALARKPNKQR